MNFVELFLSLMNAIFFYAGWLICLWGAQAGKGWVGVVFTIAVFGLHCCLTKGLRKEIALSIIIVALGTFLDSCYQNWGWVHYASPNRMFPMIAPLWISSLYLLLAINMNHSLYWLSNRPYLAALLGAWGGVASYIAGERIGAAQFSSEWVIVYIGAIWLFFFPFLFWMGRQLDRFPYLRLATKKTEKT